MTECKGTFESFSNLTGKTQDAYEYRREIIKERRKRIRQKCSALTIFVLSGVVTNPGWCEKIDRKVAWRRE